jgi:hypothetical protein
VERVDAPQPTGLLSQLGGAFDQCGHLCHRPLIGSPKMEGCIVSVRQIPFAEPIRGLERG